MTQYNTVYTFAFNSGFTIKIEEGTESTLVLSRIFLEDDGEVEIIFDIMNGYNRLTEDDGKVRYVTNGVKRKIEDELSQSQPELFATIFKGKAKIQAPAGGNQMTGQFSETEQALATSIVELQKTMAVGFNTLLTKNPYEDAIVQAVIEKGKSVTTEGIEAELKVKLDEFIRETYGELPKTIRVQEGDFVKKEISGIFHAKFDTILKIVSRDVPLMLVGPAGSGKNHTLEQVAESLELDFYFTNAITQEYTLKGFIDANGRFHETEFYKAFTKGGLFFLDEMDASIPEALIVMNAAIANRYFDFPNGRVNAHENFRVVAAANTVGTGASSEYVGRNQLDAATLDRFVQIEFNYDPQIESKLACNTDLYDFVIGLRNNITKNDVRYIVSMRATINASKLDDLLDTNDIIDNVILKGMANEDRRLLVKDLPNNRYTTALKAIVG